MIRKYINIFVYIFIVFLICNFNIQAAGVRPMVLDFSLNPGDNKEFKIILTPGGSVENLKLSLFHPIQNLDGGLSYISGESGEFDYLSWINLEEKEVVVPADEEREVKGNIIVPYDASGSYTSVIMIEPQEEESFGPQDMMSFKVRYAVRLNIDIDTPGQRARAEINNLRIEKNGDGNPQISLNITNISTVHFNAEAEATLRDENKRLIERLKLVSKAAERAKSLSTRIYPNSEVIFSGELSQPLYPGEYTLQTYLKYGDNRQLIERKTLYVEEELRKSGPRRYISYEPEFISENLRAGSPSTQVIDINNLFNEEIKIKIKQIELFDELKHSLFNIGELQIRGGEEFLLAPRGSARSVLIFRSNRDTLAGGYYGKLSLEVFDKNEELLETRNIDLEMLIGENWEYSAKITDFNFENDEGVQTFKFNLLNLSQAHINPGGIVILKNDENQIMKTINVNTSEKNYKLLPGKVINMIGKTSQIEAGTYNAEIVVTNNNEEIKRINTSVDVN